MPLSRFYNNLKKKYKTQVRMSCVYCGYRRSVTRMVFKKPTCRHCIRFLFENSFIPNGGKASW